MFSSFTTFATGFTAGHDSHLNCTVTDFSLYGEGLYLRSPLLADGETAQSRRRSRNRAPASNVATDDGAIGSHGKARTCDHSVNSRELYLLSYMGIYKTGRNLFYRHEAMYLHTSQQETPPTRGRRAENGVEVCCYAKDYLITRKAHHCNGSVSTCFCSPSQHFAPCMLQSRSCSLMQQGHPDYPDGSSPSQ